MLQSFKEFWQRSFDFQGVTNRWTFWVTYFVQAAIISILFLLTAVVSTSVDDGATIAILLVLLLYIVLSIIPNIAIGVRRLRSGGFPPLLYLISLIPGAGIVLFVLFCLPDKYDEDDYDDEE